MTDDLDVRLAGLEHDRELCVHVARFYALRLIPNCDDDSLREIADILDTIFGHLEAMYTELDLTRRSRVFLMEQIERLDEQLENYDRGVSLDVDGAPDN